MVKFIKLQESSIIPQRGTQQSAGYDLHALEGGIILAGERKLIKTGIGWKVDQGICIVGIIKDRSSVAYKKGITTMAGVIDADYPSDQDIGAILLNTNDVDYLYKAGDRIAQLVIVPFLITEDDEAMQSKVARNGGFGSTEPKS